PAILRLSNVIDGHDPRVVEASQQARFGPKGIGIPGGSGGRGRRNLDGYYAAELLIVPLIDDTEATRTKRSRDPVPPQVRAGGCPWDFLLEDLPNELLVGGEAQLIFLRPRRLTLAITIRQLEPQKLAQQGGAFRFGRADQVVLDARSLLGFP